MLNRSFWDNPINQHQLFSTIWILSWNQSDEAITTHNISNYFLCCSGTYSNELNRAAARSITHASPFACIVAYSAIHWNAFSLRSIIFSGFIIPSFVSTSFFRIHFLRKLFFLFFAKLNFSLASVFHSYEIAKASFELFCLENALSMSRLVAREAMVLRQQLSFRSPRLAKPIGKRQRNIQMIFPLVIR